ncbi:HU family DNA-binding protein [Tateyamaria omphalii]|uniref:HU family DNA-binding protein n=1 Tax=Tateyamaria omphalii TaxID=299262 RepID=UPI001C99D523|nr:HU family DNA-binding protein [Tateyamaria omphalii]MBY5935550.1 HU family DNA-binding protein [Tateyamaria omphalii]
MKLNELADVVAEDTKMSKRDARRFANSLFVKIRETALSGEKVAISGLGSFVLTEREATQRQAADGSTKDIAPARYVSFRPSRSATGRKRKADTAEASTTA